MTILAFYTTIKAKLKLFTTLRKSSFKINDEFDFLNSPLSGLEIELGTTDYTDILISCSDDNEDVINLYALLETGGDLIKEINDKRIYSLEETLFATLEIPSDETNNLVILVHKRDKNIINEIL